jgi:nucleotide-binding universal stress UspA family protein
VSVILAALDSSTRAGEVLGAAVEIARQTGGSVRLLQVAHLPLDLPPSLFTISTDAAIPFLEEQCERRLAELAKRVPPALLAGASVRAGVPWEVICHEAQRVDASLIVVGAHGHGIGGFLTGSTAARVADRADRSVLVVR